MENIILSMLLIKSMTIYEMRQFLQQTLSSVCSDSLGSLQAALKNLLAKHCISYKERIENNVFKKEYSITKDGVAQFNDWITKPMNYSKARNMEHGKFFFLGLTSKEKRIQSISGYLENLTEELVTTERLCQMVESAEENAIRLNMMHLEQDSVQSNQLLMLSGESTLEAAVKNIYDYQIYHLKYEISMLREEIAFYSLILRREKKADR